MTTKATPLTLSFLTSQPRWLLLSLFLILWSWSSGFRRDPARPSAFGLGVEARGHPFAEHEMSRRLVGLPACAERCAIDSSLTVGCGESLNFACACHNPQFMEGAVNCMTSACSTEDKAEGQATLMTACLQAGTSVSVGSTIASVSTTSITSGIPPVSPPSTIDSSTEASSIPASTDTTTPVSTETATPTTISGSTTASSVPATVTIVTTNTHTAAPSVTSTTSSSDVASTIVTSTRTIPTAPESPSNSAAGDAGATGAAVPLRGLAAGGVAAMVAAGVGAVLGL